MLVQDISATNTISALLLTIAAAGLLLKPSDFNQDNSDTENDVLQWLYVITMFASLCAALLSLLMGTEKTLTILAVHPSRIKRMMQVKASLFRKGAHHYRWYKRSTFSLAISILIGVYLIHGRYVFVTCFGMLSLTIFPLVRMKRYGDAAYDLALADDIESHVHTVKCNLYC